MQIGVPKETGPGEVRTALVPANASKLIKQGFAISMQAGAGQSAGFADAEYEAAGVAMCGRRRRGEG